jgi:cephalosporin hydroxylase
MPDARSRAIAPAQSALGAIHRRARGLVPRTAYALVDNCVVWAFHRLYYQSGSRTWSNTFWLGTQAQKCPLDLWIYQEILHELRPALIVETGTASGGSALFLASVCDLLDHGSIVTIDIVDRPERPTHERITYLRGSSVSAEIRARVEELARDSAPVMVILDSNHERDHVLQELRIYSPLVTPGSYLIVEDTNVNGHPVSPDFGPGPMEAVDEFLRDSDEFTADRTREKLYLTFNPGGYLQKRSDVAEPHG